MIRMRKEPLAIVGMGCRLPGGSRDPKSFWKTLCEGQDAIIEVPPGRWNLDRYYASNPQLPGRMITRWGGFIDRIDEFDARFFGISPREALRMDPQQRWLLEVTWEAMEDGGQSPDRWAGTNVGVFVGISSNDYANIQMKGPFDVDVHTNSGSTLSIASGRISYLFDLKGPSMSVDTACSSALVAVNLACNSIWDGQCEAAVAAGVNALLTPDSSIGFSKASMLSPDGRCFAFDERANGYVRGEGAGAIILKPLSRAQADRDPIYAIIRATVVNQDGRTNAMTVPGQESQENMLEEAYRDADISPGRVSYMEAHGTGTPVGDPIEVKAIGGVLSRYRDPGDPCAIGSVKTNIGHLESASGIAGLIKTALILKYGKIPPNLHFETPNPNIPFEELCLRVPTELEDLPRNGEPAIVAVNSFGFGGTNAHVVLQEPPSEDRAECRHPLEGASGEQLIVPISGQTDESLTAYLKAYRHYLEANEEGKNASVLDIAHTAALRKAHFESRVALLAESGGDLIEQIDGLLEGAEPDLLVQGRAPKDPIDDVVFVYTGQGPQWWGMGRELLDDEPVFHAAVERCDEQFKTYSGWSILDELRRDEATSRMDDTDVAQPCIFALQVALTALWRSRGVAPSAVVGYSVGEVAAAYEAGIYSLPDATRIIFHRSRLQEATRGSGRMVAVAISWDEARELIKGHESRIAVTGISSPGLVTLAGDSEVVEAIVNPLQDEQIFVRWLPVDFAFHTHQMDPMKEELLATLEGIVPMASKIPFYSTVTGEVLAGERLDGGYWWQNVRNPVRFAPAVDQLLEKGYELFLELGPHPSMASSLRECFAHAGKPGQTFPSLRSNEPERQRMLLSFAELYVAGYPVSWESLYGDRGSFVRLPGYPWQHESYWLESRVSREYRLGGPDHPLLGSRIDAHKPTWHCNIDLYALAYLQDHRVRDSIVCPAAAYAEAALGASRVLFPDEPYVVEDIRFLGFLFLSEERPTGLRTIFDEEDGSIEIYSSSGEEDEPWELHAQGRLQKLSEKAPRSIDLNELRDRLTEHIEHQKLYSDFDEAGFQFGPCFSEIQRIWRVPNESLGEIEVPEKVRQTSPAYELHPAILDACFQCLRGAQEVAEGESGAENFFIPVSIERIRLFNRPGSRLFCHARILYSDEDVLEGDLTVSDPDGNVLAEIKRFRVERVERTESRSGDDLDNCFYQFHWKPVRHRGSGISRHEPIVLNSPSEIVAALQPEVASTYAEHRLDEYARGFIPQMETLSLHYVLRAFGQLGWAPEVGEAVSVDSLIESLGVAHQNYRLMHSLFNALVRSGLVQADGPGRGILLARPETESTKAICEDIGRKYPNWYAETELIRDCGPALADVLVGAVDGLEIIFPGGDQSKSQRFYTGSADFKANNYLIQQAVRSIVDSLPADATLRILEVGAGTGSMTEVVVPLLPPLRTEYFFTDITPYFGVQARKQFGEYPFIEYGVLDITKDPAEQDFDLRSFDLILATNVLHATADLDESLGNIRKLLCSNGILIFLEVTRKLLFLDLVFGLTRDWWGFTDVHLRSHHPLLSREEWEATLHRIGFEDVHSFVNTVVPDEAVQALILGQVGAQPEVEKEASPGTAETEQKRWLIFGDEGCHGGAIAEQLSAPGHTCWFVESGEGFASHGNRRFLIKPDDLEDMRHLFSLMKERDEMPSGIIHCWSLDHTDSKELTSDRLEAEQATGSLSVLNLVQALVEAELSVAPRLWLLTKGAQSIGDSEGAHAIASTPLLGLARVINNEQEGFSATVVDLDSSRSREDIDLFLDELISSDDELEMGYRGGIRYVNRLVRVKPDEQPLRTRDSGSGEDILPFRLEIPTPGILENLTLRETTQPELGPRDVRIRVAAVGMNFRDVMKALGMYPGDSPDLKWLGDECAGTICAAGSDVTEFQVGDEVAAMAPYCCSSFTTVNASLVFEKPDHMTFAEAATLPIAFLTAYYTLIHLARLEAGERVLIHAGAGGVGQAAIQIARMVGAEVFTTASSEKRDFLHRQGIEHVMDSRSLDFADEILEVTAGRGVDVVLNHLAGPFIAKSISVLAPYGRFIEIGKIDIYRNSKIGLEPFKNNISYFAVDLAKHLEERPQFVARLLQRLSVMFAEKRLNPLPFKAFPISQAEEAFRYLAQARNIGKNILVVEGESVPVGPPDDPNRLFRSDASYLITGGFGGFGLEVAQWMVKRGAGCLVLNGRKGPTTVEHKRAIEAMTAAGARIEVAKGDVSKGEDVARIIAEIDSSLPPLRGVFHAAMSLDDGFLVQLDSEQFSKVLRPKMTGGWNLHLQTMHLPLDHFVLFSSASSMIGAAGQGNYASANYFLDALAHYRNSIGLPVLTVNWGALSEAGYVARNDDVAKYLEALGLENFTIAEALSIFEKLLPRNSVQIGACRVDWKALPRFNPSAGKALTYSEVAQSTDPSTSSTGDTFSFRPKVLSATPEDRLQLVEDYICEQVAQVFGTTANKIDRETPLTQIGLDSLMAIELMNRLESSLGISLPMAKFLQGPNISQLAVAVLDLLMKSADGQDDEAASRSESGRDEDHVDGNEFVEEYPLSLGQKGLWFLDRLAPESTAYHFNFGVKFSTKIDLDAVKQALTILIERHPALRVRFSMDEGSLVQRIDQDHKFLINEFDASHWSDGELKEKIAQAGRQRLDLSNGPLLRLSLFAREHEDTFVLSFHHIVFDVWSLAVFLDELFIVYFSILAGTKISLPPAEAYYSDYVTWQQRLLDSAEGERHWKYWKNQLQGPLPVLNLPTDHPRPPVQRLRGALHPFKLSSDLSREINTLANNEGATLFMTLLAAFQGLLHQYTGQDDIIVGSPMSGRSQPEFQKVVGFFANPVALRARFSERTTFRELLSQVRKTVLDTLEHQDYPFLAVIERLELPHDPSRSPVFQVQFAMEKSHSVDQKGMAVFSIGQEGFKIDLGGLVMESIDFQQRDAQFDITLLVEESMGSIFAAFEYNTDLFGPDTIAQMGDQFRDFIESVVVNPDLPIGELPLLSKVDRNRLVSDWNQTDSDYPSEKTLHGLIGEIAEKRRDLPAVTSRGISLSYGELVTKADTVAAALRERNVAEGTSVGVLIDRSSDMLVALLGVLKTGACYIPLDPKFPAHRLQQMLDDSAPRFILTRNRLDANLPRGCWQPLDLDTLIESNREFTGSAQDSSSLAYIIYTSGSTGSPKGVEISHRALLNLLWSMKTRPGLSSDDVLLAVTTLSFDIAALELFLPLVCGGQVVIASGEEASDGRRLAALVEEFAVTTMQATPALWQMLFDSGWEGQSRLKVFSGGEALPRQLANRLVDSCAEVWNLYGPTETTIWSAADKVKKEADAVPIGRPIGNTKIYILDEHDEPVPVGFAGSLFIGGDGLARGYHKRPDLTDERFVVMNHLGCEKERLYRTSDVARYRLDGTVEYLGRSDFQVKLRGFRIELGDIEAHLTGHPAVSQAVVVKCDDLPGGESLVAYVIPTEERPRLIPELRNYLAEHLPDYMRPGVFMLVDTFPLTPNKKIDRLKLPVPEIDREAVAAEYVAPQTPSEKILVDILNQAFETSKIGIRDNFFELGGDSLLAVQILSSVSAAFNREIPIEVFLRNPRVESLAHFLDLSPEIEDRSGLGSNGHGSEDDLLEILDTGHLSLVSTGSNGGREQLPSVDAVALAYIPDAFVPYSGLSKEEIAHSWFHGRPHLTNLYETSYGRIGLLMLPCMGAELYKDQETLGRTILQAFEMAAEMGARSMSLTGLIPSATNYGHGISDWVNGREDFPAVTTGHATTTATIVKTMEGVLRLAHRDMADEIMAVIGLGSIGRATLRLALEVLPHPRELILCDLYQKSKVLESIRDEIVTEAGFQGAVRLEPTYGKISGAVYEATFIVGATNVPGILDINRLGTGTLIVDDSFPPCFRLIDGIRRAEEKRDLLFTTGGLLRFASQINETIFLPNGGEAFIEQHGSSKLRALAARDPQELTGCIFSSLLTAKWDDVQPTLGPVTIKDSMAHYRFLESLGIEVARPQCESYFIDPELIAEFKNFNGRRATQVDVV